MVTQAGRQLEANLFIQSICYSTELEGKKQHLIAIITKDDRLNRHPCYVFRTPFGMAREVCDRVSNKTQK